MTSRQRILAFAVAAAALVPACDGQNRGPIIVSAIGAPAEIANPNLKPLDPPSAMLIEAAAQGLVRFDATGQVEPALAQRWILSDDGLRYTFRLSRATWPNGRRVTAEEVASRLRAATSASSKNPLKPYLGVIAEIEAMTDDVLEISLRGPRPNFLQLLAQPEMGIIRNGQGTGPYDLSARDGSVLLAGRADEEEAEGTEPAMRDIVLRGEAAAMAVARFDGRDADLVTGGTAGTLPIARAARPAATSLRFDPAVGLFGLAFVGRDGPLGDPDVRRALSMAIDRSAIAASLGVPEPAPRASLIPPGIDELPSPAVPDWAASPLPMRRALAAQAIAEAAAADPVTVRVSFPDEPGYRLIFAHVRRDWRAIGVTTEAVPADAEADLRLVDAVAAANLSTWYLRRFSCAVSRVCSPEADQMLEAARTTENPAERQALLAGADRALTELTPFIPIVAPVRWSLVSTRLTGFRTNPFARHFLGSLIADRS